jgi:DNA polymerase-3 subunit epsilon
MFIADNSPANRKRVVAAARQVLLQSPVYLDTETTGLDRRDEIIEISIIDDNDQVLFESLVKPTQPVPADVIQIHGITNEMVQGAPSWPAIWMKVRSLLFGRLIAIYNAEFDLRMMQQTHARHRLPWKDYFKTFDIMKLYAEYQGEWDMARRAYRYPSLERAGRQFHIPLQNSHRASDDTRLARAVLHKIAESD